MLYYLFEYLQEAYNLPGAGVFQYISFRSAMAVITSLLVSMVFGRRIINLIRKKQIGEQVRVLGLEGEEQRRNANYGRAYHTCLILIPTLLFTKLENIYIIIMIISTVWLGAIGFIDDYIKVYKDKEGLAGRFKILGQVGLGIIVGLIMIFSPDIVVKEQMSEKQILESYHTSLSEEFGFEKEVKKSAKTTIPFVKNNAFDYEVLTKWMGAMAPIASLLLFVLIVILIITAVSNGANMTDGLDGLATGTSAIIGATIAVFSYVSGNIVAADYLNIMYIPNTGELVIFMASFVGACVGFLWYNSYPAQVFMGDTGSLSLGGIIAVAAILIRKELLIPILCGVFLIENLSVIMQVGYFKYTKNKYGEGKEYSRWHHCIIIFKS